VRRGLLICACLLICPAADAATTCTFALSDTTMRLVDDCTTDSSIVIPDGITFDGGHHTIVAIDPAGGTFSGAVLTNAGVSASVIDTSISAPSLANVCRSGAERLRGIYFEGASGVIRGNTVVNVNKGDSSCPEGNAIEARNASLSGMPVLVEIDHNTVDGYQKSGIVITGRVEATIHHNVVGASAAQGYLAANAVQIGAWAQATIENNTITGNSAPTAAAAGTAILLIGCGQGTIVRSNVVRGNSDVGIYIAADGVLVHDNRLADSGPDGYYDVGIGNYGLANLFSGNVVRGFATPSEGVEPAARQELRIANLE
jgi:parallel beta-helix repeat protein